MRSQQGLFSLALYGLVDHRPRTGLPHGGDRGSGRPSTFQQLVSYIVNWKHIPKAWSREAEAWISGDKSQFQGLEFADRFCIMLRLRVKNYGSKVDKKRPTWPPATDHSSGGG
ncbi:predicted protein [Histoplasma capsulatum var. duboisii H88]|uniref:Predicted protein n=1 Tax=Ajellomyces capsulatus (strain H88) TaxID=544711 RepID=F0UK22_AJEC8|nr:predicted protein [Histoplasma capsulatum var. duboisii H88]